MPSFLSPLFLLGAVTAVIPIVLHFLGRRPEIRVKFSAVHLLTRTSVEISSRSRLREWLLLALRVTALGLLALAFARPFFAAGTLSGNGSTTIVAVDVSYSMSSPGRFERARALARDAVSRVSAADRVGVVAFDDAATLVSAPSVDRVLARSAIDALAPGAGATQYRSGLAAAAHALAGRPGTIVIVSDMQAIGWDAGVDASVTDSTRVELVDVGALPPNLSVTAIHAAGKRIVGTVQNAGPVRREARVRLSLDNQRSDERTTVVAPHASVEVAFEISGRPLTAAMAVEDPEGLQADNTRYLVIDANAHQRVLVVTATGDLGRDAFYVLHALNATAQNVEPFDVAGVTASNLSTWDEARLRQEAVILLLSTRGLERRGREALTKYVRGGGGLLVAAGPDLDGVVVADVLGNKPALRIALPESGRPVERAFAPVDIRHPIFQPFAASAAMLDRVTFHRVSAIGSNGCRPIARFTTGEAALIDCQAGEGGALVFASDLNNRWNDFPVHAAFLPFLHEAIRHLGNTRPQSLDYRVADRPPGVLAKPGIVTRSTREGETAQPVAINVDPREADPARLESGEFQAAIARVKGAGLQQADSASDEQEERQHLWQYALILIVGVLAAESAVGRRASS